MAKTIELITHQVRLRQWKQSDRRAFAIINADPEVMKYFPNVLKESESNQLAETLQSKIKKQGWGLWALEEIESRNVIGFLGLQEVAPELPFAPAVEIGWRLARPYWGRGYITQAARVVLEYAFETLNLDEVCSFATIHNKRSRAVMERLHMLNTNQNFEHPDIPFTSPLREHVLYKLTRERWERHSGNS